MDKVIKLTKIFLKNSFSNMDARMGISTKSKSKIIVYGLLFLYFAGTSLNVRLLSFTL